MAVEPTKAIFIVGTVLSMLLGVVIFYLVDVSAAVVDVSAIVKDIRRCTGPGFSKSYGCP